MEQIKKSRSLCLRLLTFLKFLSFAAFSFSALGLAMYAYSKTGKYLNILQDTIRNWNTSPILDIKTTLTTCPATYTPAFQYTFPGNSPGCYCGNVSPADQVTLNLSCITCQNACTSLQLNLGCINVNASSPKTLSAWGATPVNFPYIICIKRSADTWTQSAPISNLNCPIGYTQCGGGNADSSFCSSNPNCPPNNY